MPLEIEFAFFQRRPEKPLFCQDLFVADLLFPLERRMGFGNKTRYRHINFTAIAGKFPLCFYFSGQLHNPFDVIHGFRRKPDHEIELDEAPASTVGGPGIREKIGFTDPLVE